MRKAAFVSGQGELDFGVSSLVRGAVERLNLFGAATLLDLPSEWAFGAFGRPDGQAMTDELRREAAAQGGRRLRVGYGEWLKFFSPLRSPGGVEETAGPVGVEGKWAQFFTARRKQVKVDGGLQVQLL